MRLRRLASTASLVAAPLVAGCGSPPKFSADIKPIIKVSCVFSECHNAATHKGGMDLETDPYHAWVGVATMNPYAAAKGWQRVVPGDHTRSFVWQKLALPVANDPDPPNGGGLGDRMPFSGQVIDSDSLQKIQDWIDNGAKND